MSEAQQDKGLLSVDEFCAWASISRRKFYLEVGSGRLTMRKVGRKSVVTMMDATSWLSALPRARMAEAA